MDIRTIYHSIYKYVGYVFYELKFNRIIKKVKNKSVKKVVFTVIDLSMWKSESLFRKLLQDPQFEPYIMSFFYPFQLLDTKKRINDEISKYCEGKGFPMIVGYDFEKDTCIDFQSIHPDIVFYAQPYNGGYKKMRMESIWNEALFAYIPYCLNLEADTIYYSTLYQNICWKSYCATEFNKKFESKCLINGGRNLIVSGHSLFDEMENRKEISCDWKQTDSKYKKIIWAPHHSIMPGELGYSNFLEIADKMIDIAKKYEDSVVFAFKPHPMLRNKLYLLPEWGKTRTDNYYDMWMHMPNTMYADGPYVDLFLSSDAMVHDSASFTCEYLYTCKPVMYISKDDDKHRSQLNDLGTMCYNLHYHGATIEEIELFIDNVINGVDPMFNARLEFKEQFLKSCGCPSDDFIYRDLRESLQV